MSILPISPIIGEKKCAEHILPIFLELLKDKNPLVRTNLLKNLGIIINVTGLESLQKSIIPALTELITDEDWRIRNKNAEILELLGD